VSGVRREGAVEVVEPAEQVRHAVAAELSSEACVISRLAARVGERAAKAIGLAEAEVGRRQVAEDLDVHREHRVRRRERPRRAQAAQVDHAEAGTRERSGQARERRLDLVDEDLGALGVIQRAEAGQVLGRFPSLPPVRAAGRRPLAGR